jgi:NAD(P)-dependent dehydrogenase (short-subunit alcohol dehydrogenase family)
MGKKVMKGILVDRTILITGGAAGIGAAAAVDHTLAAFGTLNGAFNNAGVVRHGFRTADTAEETGTRLLTQWTGDGLPELPT